MSGLRWFRFKEGFSTRLVCLLMVELEAGHPFAGIDTTPLTACGMGLRGTGIEFMPVGLLVAQGIAAAVQVLLSCVTQATGAEEWHRFRHVAMLVFRSGLFPVASFRT